MWWERLNDQREHSRLGVTGQGNERRGSNSLAASVRKYALYFVGFRKHPIGWEDCEDGCEGGVGSKKETAGPQEDWKWTSKTRRCSAKADMLQRILEGLEHDERVWYCSSQDGPSEEPATPNRGPVNHRKGPAPNRWGDGKESSPTQLWQVRKYSGESGAERTTWDSLRKPERYRNQLVLCRWNLWVAESGFRVVRIQPIPWPWVYSTDTALHHSGVNPAPEFHPGSQEEELNIRALSLHTS